MSITNEEELINLKFLIHLIILFSIMAPTVLSNYLYIDRDTNDIVEIRIGLYTDEEENQYFYKFSYSRYFIFALRDYMWTVGDVTYIFKINFITTDEICKGLLTKENYDLLLYPPDTADEYLIFTGNERLPKNKLREANILKFIESGGGYFGTCGGSLIASNMINDPESFLEKKMEKSCIELSCTQFKYKTSIPILTQMIGNSPESIGTMAYIYNSGWNITPYEDLPLTGACLDCSIYKDHAIFSNYHESIRRIRWIGSPGLMIPCFPDRDIKILAQFPKQEVSDNDSTRIHFWKYTGGIRGLIQGLIFGDGGINWAENLGVLMRSFVFSSDWECLPNIVETDVAETAFMTAEIYPNENQARIVLCVGHPELNVWWGGHIEELEETEDNNLYDGLHHWVEIIPKDETEDDEISYNFWIIRRSIAWSSQKVPDDHLPPVYGTSQVKKIDSFSLPMKIIGIAKKEIGVESLSLYYRCRGDNQSKWTDWILYDTDTDSKEWSWDFVPPNGKGIYQFYSIKTLINGDIVETEKIPPGEDATIILT